MTAAVMPTYPELRRRVAALLLDRGEWAGVPLPIEGLSLAIEDKYPYQQLGERVPSDLDAERDPELDANGLRPGETLVNSWYSERAFSYIFIVRTAEGRGLVFRRPEYRYVRRLNILLKNFQAAWAHDSDADLTALMALADHVTPEQLRQYMVLGQFLERSKRSGVTYVFRRCAPTIAIRATDNGTRMLAALCLHPIAYYRETTVGAMTPTDDVLAHLLLMRGDEPMFWRRANQHSPIDPEAML